MSEKRFVIDEEGISDNKTDKWYCWKEEVVDLLNELNDENKELKKENEQLKKRLYLYERSEDEVDKYLRTHPMPTTTITNKRKVIPLDMRHKW